MIRKTVIDDCLNRLSAHFGPRLVVRPPAPAAKIAELEAIVGPLPRDYVFFLATCDGLRLHLDAPEQYTHLWHVSEIEERILAGQPVPDGFLPIRGDATGECDHLVIAAGPLHGAIVRWSLWEEGADLISSSFGADMDCWTHYLIEQFDSNGHRRSKNGSILYDAAVTGRFDQGLAELRKHPHVQAALHGLDTAVASGADFE